MSLAVEIAERALVPDWLIRRGVRRLLFSRLEYERRADGEQQQERLRRFIERLRQSPIAIRTEQVNIQHYELPASFFHLVLGKWKKYSCCYWPAQTAQPDASLDVELDAAEESMLALTCQRAQISDGMRVLDLGCGWGSLSLWIASHYPSCRITALSNSRLQRESIEADCRRLGLSNIRVLTGDVSSFDTDETFDRIVSVEMFEHMRNYELLLAKIRRWLVNDGKLFVHVFCHRHYAYTFEEEASSWMGSEFFSGGTMPSDSLLLYFQRDLILEDHWSVDGRHYARTLRAWLEKLDAARERVLEIFSETYGPERARRQLQRWRLFFIGCEESFAFRGGWEWYVSHYLFRPR
ncbi:MAG: class I SAM-dependent methyltransferase [Acidobacteriota bacterium]|nr:MAG: class I SAM-dependent methyltransferase [Acidobacteriota bacterium]